jgi:anti-sigma B factor antagonist
VYRIDVQQGSEHALVRAEGELDAFAAGDISAAFEETGTARTLIADLSAVSFLDSTALGLIVRGVRGIGERGGRARVVLPLTTARRIFEITTLDRVLPVSESRAAAVTALAADGGRPAPEADRPQSE